MNAFVETLTPAARNHAEARIEYYTDLNQTVLQSLRQLADVNLQFSRDWLDQSSSVLRNALLTPPSERDASAAPQAAESVVQKLQAYHQKLAEVASEFQANLTRVAQEHVPQTTRTASELAEAGKTAGQHLTEEAKRFTAAAQQNQAFPQAASVQSAPEGNKN